MLRTLVKKITAKLFFWALQLPLTELLHPLSQSLSDKVWQVAVYLVLWKPMWFRHIQEELWDDGRAQQGLDCDWDVPEVWAPCWLGIEGYGSSRYRYMFVADISANTDTDIFG